MVQFQWFTSGWRDMSSGRDLTERTNLTFCREQRLTAHPAIIIRLEVRLLITISHYLGRSANKQTSGNYTTPLSILGISGVGQAHSWRIGLGWQGGCLSTVHGERQTWTCLEDEVFLPITVLHSSSSAIQLRLIERLKFKQTFILFYFGEVVALLKVRTEMYISAQFSVLVTDHFKIQLADW